MDMDDMDNYGFPLRVAQGHAKDQMREKFEAVDFVPAPALVNAPGVGWFIKDDEVSQRLHRKVMDEMEQGEFMCHAQAMERLQELMAVAKGESGLTTEHPVVIGDVWQLRPYPRHH